MKLTYDVNSAEIRPPKLCCQNIPNVFPKRVEGGTNGFGTFAGTGVDLWHCKPILTTQSLTREICQKLADYLTKAHTTIFWNISRNIRF